VLDARVASLRAEQRDANPDERHEARRANAGEPTTSTFAVESLTTSCKHFRACRLESLRSPRRRRVVNRRGRVSPLS